MLLHPNALQLLGSLAYLAADLFLLMHSRMSRRFPMSRQAQELAHSPVKPQVEDGANTLC
jgi:hypothetical protein